MSIKGKKLAQLNMSLRIARMIIESERQLLRRHPIAAITQREAVKAKAIRLSEAVSRTPHEHFNKHGKIDKRKVKRYERRKAGSTYIVSKPTKLTMEHLKALKDKMYSTEIEIYNYSKELIEGHTEPLGTGMVESKKGK